jgi:Saccharopine dehydrogenase NADP binding domain/Domain of unknown function (DUF4166)
MSYSSYLRRTGCMTRYTSRLIRFQHSSTSATAATATASVTVAAGSGDSDGDSDSGAVIRRCGPQPGRDPVTLVTAAITTTRRRANFNYPVSHSSTLTQIRQQPQLLPLTVSLSHRHHYSSDSDSDSCRSSSCESQPLRQRIIVLGGYGEFGSRIVSHLYRFHSNVDIFVAGRNVQQAKAACHSLMSCVQSEIASNRRMIGDESQSWRALAHVEWTAATPPSQYPQCKSSVDNSVQPLVVDAMNNVQLQERIASTLHAKSSDVLINCIGPFDDPDYTIARACIDQGIHYIDLADNRQHVVNFAPQLHSIAERRNVAAFAGASTVPTLTSATIEALCHEAEMEPSKIHMYICPGNNAPRGVATVKSVLQHLGVKYEAAPGQLRWGWLNTETVCLRGITPSRLCSNIDVPDLPLLRKRYPSLVSLEFKAGMELRLLHLPIVVAGWMSKFRLTRFAWWKAAPILARISLYLSQFGSTDGALRIDVSGKTTAAFPDSEREHNIASHTTVVSRTFQLLASGDGPVVPAMASCIIAQKLQNDPKWRESHRGAHPAFELISLADFRRAFNEYNIETFTASRIENENENDGPMAAYMNLDAWSDMPVLIRDFHMYGGTASGVLNVESSTLYRITAKLLSFVSPLRDMLGFPVVYDGEHHVCVTSDSMQWKRVFQPTAGNASASQGFMMTSRWGWRGGVVTETFGPWTFGFHLKPSQFRIDSNTVSPVGFAHITKRQWFLGIPVPMWMGVNADGVTVPNSDGTGWKVAVCIQHRLVGFLFSYMGSIDSVIANRK